MNAKDIFKKFLASFKAELEAADVTPKEGELKVSEVAVGGKVEMVDGEGNLIPASDGVYEYGGHSLEVRDGVIVSVDGDKPAEEAPGQNSAQEVKEEMSEEASALPSEIESLKAETAELRKMIDEMKNAVAEFATQKDVNHFSAHVLELTDLIKKLANVPAEFSKTSTNNVVKDSKDEKLTDVTRIINNIRK